MADPLTGARVDTNIDSLPPDQQARISAETVGSTTFFSVTGPAPLRDLVVTTNTNAPNLVLDGSFRNCNFVGGAEVSERWVVTGGATSLRSALGGNNRIAKTNFVLGKDSFKDTLKFEKGAIARKVTIKDFAKGDKLKYRGDVYRFSDITANGKGFEGLSRKQIRLA